MDFETQNPSVQYCVKKDFRMVEFQDTEDSHSEHDELEVLKAQDEDSEVRSQKGEAVYEKFHNSVVEVSSRI